MAFGRKRAEPTPLHINRERVFTVKFPRDSKHLCSSTEGPAETGAPIESLMSCFVSVLYAGCWQKSSAEGKKMAEKKHQLPFGFSGGDLQVSQKSCENGQRLCPPRSQTVLLPALWHWIQELKATDQQTQKLFYPWAIRLITVS